MTRVTARQRFAEEDPSGRLRLEKLPEAEIEAGRPERPAAGDPAQDNSTLGLLLLGRSFFGGLSLGRFGRLFLFLLLLKDHRLDTDFC